MLFVGDALEAPGPSEVALEVEMAIGSMYELEAIGELLEQRGVMTKEEIIDLAKALIRKTPTTESRTANTTAIPPPPRFTDTDNAVIEEIMAVILQHGLSADQATAILGRTIQLLEWGQQAAHKIPEVNA